MNQKHSTESVSNSPCHSQKSTIEINNIYSKPYISECKVSMESDIR